MEFREERETLNDVHRKLSDQQLDDYRQRKNARSIDGFPTALPRPAEPQPS